MATLKVRQLMRRDFPRAAPTDSVAKVRDLMYEHRIRHVPVLGPDRGILGLASHRDLLRDAGIESYDRPVWIEDERLARLPISEVMRTMVQTVSPDDSAAAAGEVMLREKFGCLPVVEDDRVVGLLTEADFVRYVVAGPSDRLS